MVSLVKWQLAHAKWHWSSVPNYQVGQKEGPWVSQLCKYTCWLFWDSHIYPDKWPYKAIKDSICSQRWAVCLLEPRLTGPSLPCFPFTAANPFIYVCERKSKYPFLCSSAVFICSWLLAPGHQRCLQSLFIFLLPPASWLNSSANMGQKALSVREQTAKALLGVSALHQVHASRKSLKSLRNTGWRSRKCRVVGKSVWKEVGINFGSK